MNSNTPDTEDAAFYAQLTRQILLLMDEDEVAHVDRTRKCSPGLGWRPLCVSYGDGRSMFSGKHFGSMEGGRSLEVPGWMENLWANNGSGTGVFIPRAVATGKPRRKRHHRSRKNKGRVDSSAEQKVHG
ncbi:hypothetical protein QVD17_20997 [Tagetes erecta]|uniref:Uncharacterized protein n=1 Tax=Tagetes erecta TaxID=13708 RepID=A0AAD8NYG7_TARER|nr:hypothetical protein QVD17_20997 [Tagetes erecta]